MSIFWNRFRVFYSITSVPQHSYFTYTLNKVSVWRPLISAIDSMTKQKSSEQWNFLEGLHANAWICAMMPCDSESIRINFVSTILNGIIRVCSCVSRLIEDLCFAGARVAAIFGTSEESLETMRAEGAIQVLTHSMILQTTTSTIRIMKVIAIANCM